MAKRVLVITPSIKPGGGPPGYVYNLMTGIEELRINQLLKNEFEFIGEISGLRNKATGNLVKSENKIRLALVKLFTKLGLKPFLSKKIRTAVIKIRKSDLVIFQGYQDTYLLNYAKKIGVKTIYMPHSPTVMADEYKMLCELNRQAFDKTTYQQLKNNESILIEKADALVFPAKGSVCEYKKIFSNILLKKKIIYIKSGVQVDYERLTSSVSLNNKREIKILFVGRYVTHKGYDLFCDAAEYLASQNEDLKFMTVGDGPMKKDSEYVTNFGWRSDIFNVLNDVDIIVVPNRIAYYDLLPLECAALGKPLVMTAVGGNVDQIADLPDSIGCVIVDVVNLALSIKEAVNKYKCDSNWGAGNKLAFDNLFTINAFAKRWDDEIEILFRDIDFKD